MTKPSDRPGSGLTALHRFSARNPNATDNTLREFSISDILALVSGSSSGSGGSSGSGSGGSTPPDVPSGTVTTTPTSLNALDFGVYGGSDATPASFLTWLGRRPTNYFVEAHLDKQSRSSWSRVENFGYNIGVAAADTVTPIAQIRLQMPLWANADMQQASIGTYDADFYTWGTNALSHPQVAAQVASGKKVRVRVMQEQNADYGTLSDWSWQHSNDPTKAEYYKLTFRRIVDQLRAAATAAGHTGVFEFEFCPNACSLDWRPGYPGRAYVDFAGMDVYQGNNGGFAGRSGAAEFEAQRTHGTGLQPYKDWATSENLPMTIPEWGVGQDGRADWVKAFLTWAAANCVSIGCWNSNAAYPGLISGGRYPQTAGQIRYMFNTAQYPLDPVALPPPPSVVANVGNGNVTLTVYDNGTGSGGAINGWLLYLNGSSTGTPITLTGGKYVLSAPNGTPVGIEVAATNPAGTGFKSVAQTRTPSASAPALPVFDPAISASGLVFSNGNRTVYNPTGGFLYAKTTALLGAGSNAFAMEWVSGNLGSGGIGAGPLAEPLGTVGQAPSSVVYFGDSGAFFNNNANTSGAKAYFTRGSLSVNTTTGQVQCAGQGVPTFIATFAGLKRSDLYWGAYIPPGGTGVVGDTPPLPFSPTLAQPTGNWLPAPGNFGDGSWQVFGTGATKVNETRLTFTANGTVGVFIANGDGRLVNGLPVIFAGRVKRISGTGVPALTYYSDANGGVSLALPDTSTVGAWVEFSVNITLTSTTSSIFGIQMAAANDAGTFEYDGLALGPA